jgi:hypothetical protein
VIADLGVAALPVDRLRDEVEQHRHLDHLAVAAARDVRRVLEARALVLADQLDALGELRRALGIGRRGREGGRLVDARSVRLGPRAVGALGFEDDGLLL